MRNNVNCAFQIYTDPEYTHMESFDTLDELNNICLEYDLRYQDVSIYLGDGDCDILTDDDFTAFYDLQLKYSSLIVYHIRLYEQGKLFKHQQ